MLKFRTWKKIEIWRHLWTPFTVKIYSNNAPKQMKLSDFIFGKG